MKNNILIILIIVLGCSSNQKLIKHPMDKSESKTLQLENGLKVYLLSDSNFNVSAASMSVEVGSYQDPDDRQGMAHFLEHMLFLGTKKYPDVDEYSTYLKTYAGYSNAYTAGDHTNYQLQVLPDGFSGALDRFSQFFIAPLFTEEYTSREVNAVNSEYQKNIMNDGWRQFRISSQFAREGHPEKKFNIGNLETLGDINRAELIEFYNQHYSSNRMGLALLSTHSLDQMEKWVKEYFSDIKNRNLARNRHDPVVLDEKETVRLINVEPIKDIRQMNIMFELPATRDMYESKPESQFGFIMGHEGKGSLLSYLKDRGWAITLSAGARAETKEYGFATVSIGLTEDGLKNYKEVLRSVVGYLDLMKSSGYQQHVFNELGSMASLNEIYSSKGEGMWRATQLANEALMFPLDDAGRVNYIYRNNSPGPYNDLVSSLKTNKMLVLLISKGLQTDRVEHFFQIKHSYFEDDSLYKDLEETVTYGDFNIPEKNPFIPKKATVPDRKIEEGKYPKSINVGPGSNAYFGQDHEFLRPKGVIGLKVFFPKEKMSIKHRVYSKFYSACVNESLNEISYPAKLAGLNYTVREGYEGLYVDINGYKESAMSLYGLILDHLIDFSITESQFEAIKDKIIRDYENFSLSDAHQQTREMGPDLIYETKYTWEDALPVSRSVSLSELKKYEGDLFEKTFTEAMIYGDFEERDAKKVVSLFQEKTGTEAIDKDKAFQISYLEMDKPESIHYTDNLLVNNSCFYRKYVIGEDSPKTRATALIISKALQQPFFTEMRTNQQLGYIVWSYIRNLDETFYLNFLIQSGVFPADELNTRANDFISTAPEILRSMDEETYKKLIESSIEELEKKPMSISERAAKLKTLIFEHSADYDRDRKTIEALRSLAKEEVATKMDYIVKEKTRKMINVLTFADSHKNKTNYQNTFSNLEDWKSKRVFK